MKTKLLAISLFLLLESNNFGQTVKGSGGGASGGAGAAGSTGSVQFNSDGTTFAAAGNQIAFTPVSPPSGNLTATATVTAGNPSGTYRYAVSFLLADGSSTTCAILNAECFSSPVTVVNAQISLTDIPVSTDNRVTARKIWRSGDISGFHIYPVLTISDNSTTTATDNVSDGTPVSLEALGIEDETVFGTLDIPGIGISRFFRANFGSLFLGYGAGGSLIGQKGAARNTLLGSSAGSSLTTGSLNVAVGRDALAATSGSRNTAVGDLTACTLDSGSNNTYLGDQAGCAGGPDSGSGNTFIGASTAYGSFAMTGDMNVALGYQSLNVLTTGANNTTLGAGSGSSLTTGSGNIFIGLNAGGSETTGSNKLYIDNSNTATPLIGGDLSARTLAFDANVSINGPLNAGARLTLADDVTAPTTAPTATELGTGTDPVAFASWTYAVTFVTADGETVPGPTSTPISTTGHNIQLSNVPISSDPRVIARRIYRGLGAPISPSTDWRQIQTLLNDNTSTTYTDNQVHSDSWIQTPPYNSTGKTIWAGSNRAAYFGVIDTVLGQGAYPGPYQKADNGQGWNVAVGDRALAAFGGTTAQGAYNTVVGSSAGSTHVNGSNNSYFGTVAGQFLATSEGVSCYGAHSCRGGLGASSLSGIAAFGDHAAWTVNASQTTCIGSHCLDGVAGNTVLTGVANSAVGYNSGTDLTTGANNTLLGSSTLAGSASGTYRTVIGAGVTGVENNSVTVGRSADSAIIQGKLRVAQQTPASAAATCVANQIAFDTGYIYICTATNTWKRAAITTW